MAIDLASNLEPVLTQMCRVNYNNNNNIPSKVIYLSAMSSDLEKKGNVMICQV